MEMTREQLRAKLSGLEVSTAWKGIVRPLLDHDQVQREKLAAYEEDMNAARGELGVRLEESPIGSLVSKLVMANRVLRSERSNLQSQVRQQAAALADVEKERDEYKGDYATMQGFLKTFGCTPSMKASECDILKQQLADVTKERDALKACQCDGCNESLEGDAYCLQCYERQRQRVDGLDERLGQLMADKDNQSRTIADMWQQLTSAQATIRRLEGEREDWKRKYQAVSTDPDYQQCCEEREKATSQLTDAQQRVREVEQQILPAFEATLNETIAKLEASQAACERLNAAQIEAGQILERKEEELEKTRCKNQNLQAIVTTLTQECDRLKASLVCDMTGRPRKLWELVDKNEQLTQQLSDAQAMVAELKSEASDLRNVEAQTQHWIGDVATEVLGYQYREISLGKLRELLQQRLATVEGALKDAIEALDYYKLHRVAGMEVLLYESRNEHCPQLTMEAIKKHLQQALAPAPGGQRGDANKMVEGD